ncbi:hypothetical protein SD77_3545 [Bacillus badius]|uniref:Ribose 5-phosphate isomerase B n=1 Tax=Bacillus badius TaxID=1455 RepID=A0ABR5AWZ8_BACBA|nr:hypothetical protein SD77_3545 [Bacillus badius]
MKAATPAGTAQAGRSQNGSVSEAVPAENICRNGKQPFFI